MYLCYWKCPYGAYTLYELIREGKIKPALIIGAPVGFVNVIQSKELILSLKDTPYIVAEGRKGGSNVAAASAMLYYTVSNKGLQFGHDNKRGQKA